MEESVDEIDIEKFIAEIQIRPAIWNPYTKESADRNIVQKSWEDILNIFIGEQVGKMNAVDRARYVTRLKYQWTRLRSSYANEYKRLVRQKSNPYRGRSEYYKELSFLMHIVKHRALYPLSTASKSSRNRDTDNFDNDESKDGEDDDDDDDDNDNTEPANSTSWSAADDADDSMEPTPTTNKTEKIFIPKNIKKERTPSIDDTNNSIKNSTNTSMDAESFYEEIPNETDADIDDSDQMFLMSLLKPLKRVPNHLRFEVKLKMMQAIERGRQSALSGTSLNISGTPEVKPIILSKQWGNV